jgi:hypothetical protein
VHSDGNKCLMVWRHPCVCSEAQGTLMFLQHLGHPRSCVLEYKLHIPGYCRRRRYVIFGSSSLHKGLKSVVADDLKGSHVLGNPPYNLGPAYQYTQQGLTNKLQGTTIPRFCGHVLLMRVRHFSFACPFEHSCDCCRIQLPFHCSLSDNISTLRSICTCHNLNPPAFLCMFAKITRQFGISCVQESPYASSLVQTVLSIALKDV